MLSFFSVAHLSQGILLDSLLGSLLKTSGHCMQMYDLLSCILKIVPWLLSSLVAFWFFKNSSVSFSTDVSSAYRFWSPRTANWTLCLTENQKKCFNLILVLPHPWKVWKISAILFFLGVPQVLPRHLWPQLWNYRQSQLCCISNIVHYSILAITAAIS